MSSTDLDVPLLPNSEQIRRRIFASVRRGFDPDQVREYLHQVADQVEALENEVREARLQAEAALRDAEAKPDRDPYEQLGGRIAELIRAADQEAEGLVRDAKEEAQRIMGEARADADRVRLDAQARAEEARQAGEEALRAARAEADRTLSDLSTRRGTLVEQLASMQERLLSVAKDLDTAIGSGTGRDDAASGDDDRREQGPTPAGGGRPPGATVVDPRYEDLWEPGEGISLGDMPPLDLDLGDND